MGGHGKGTGPRHCFWGQIEAERSHPGILDETLGQTGISYAKRWHGLDGKLSCRSGHQVRYEMQEKSRIDNCGWRDDEASSWRMDYGPDWC